MRTPIDLRLARHGAILLVLAMLTGFIIGSLHSRAVGNAAHLTGLIGGYGLISLGLLWPKLSLGRVWSAVGAWVTAISLYLNWLGLMCKGLGNGPNMPSQPFLGSPLVWDRAGTVALTLAVLFSLSSAL